MNSKLFTFLFSLLACQVIAQQKTTFISRDSALSDLRIIRQTIEEVHPGLDRFGQKKGFLATCDSVQQVIGKSDSLSAVAFFRIVNPLIAKVKCGHLKFLPPVKDFPFYYHTEHVLPFIVRFDDAGRLLIVRAADAGFQGQIIQNINGMDMAQILHMLRQNMFVDGNITNSADAQIQQYFSAWYADFIQDSSDFKLILKDESDHSTRVSVSGITSADWLTMHRGFTEISMQNELRFENDSTAVLRIATFYMSSNKAFKRFLKDSFKQIKERNTSRLVIDVRGNEGGMDALGKELYSYIAKTDFRYYDRVELNVRRKKDITYRDLAYFPRFSGLASLFVKRQKDESLRWTKHQNLGTHRPKRNAFEKDVIFLVDGLSYSVTSEFLAVAKSESRGIFIGSESGGAYAGDNSGAFLIIKLPASRFDLGIPVAGYYSAVKAAPEPARGIMPDFPIRPSAADLLSGKDIVLESALTQPWKTISAGKAEQ